MKIAILGTGYVGLITGVCLAKRGHKVVSVDINLDIVNRINKCKAHIYEKNLNELLYEVIESDNFYATNSLEKALDVSEAVIVAVGTPSQNGDIDLSFIKSVTRDLGQYMKDKRKPITVIVKSTVVPGTTDTVIRNILEKESGYSLDKFGLGMNPEFLKEGSAIYDFMHPDRIIFGTEDEKSLFTLERLYKSWDCKKIIVNSRTAEFIKYTNNTILASQISLSNELSLLASKIGEIDFQKVLEGFQSDYRWSSKNKDGFNRPEILSYQIPGCGFGGSCFPKDIEAFTNLGVKKGLDMQMTRSILDVNSRQPYQVLQLIEQTYGPVKNKNILLLGLAFKPETDDIRESASLKIIESMYGLNNKIIVHDPKAMINFKKYIGINYPNLKTTSDWKIFLNEIDIIIIATKWKEYEELSELKTSAELIFDCRRLLKKSQLKYSNYLTFGYNFKNNSK
tara:strand:+ start:185 stop:1540 length:1356 start_codon:yes stop_codon:yes gene_type:complete